MATTNPFESPTSSSASDGEENGRYSPCLEIRLSSSSGNSSAYFEDCLADNGDEEIGEFCRDQETLTPAPPGVFNDQLHSLLSGQHQDTNPGVTNIASYGSANADYISPLEAALLYGVVSPASYNDGERDDEDESEEDDSRGLLSPAPSGGSWWNRIVDTFSPTPSKVDDGGRSGIFTQVESSGDDASFKSARSRSSGGDGSDDIDHEAYHKTSQDPPPSLSVQFHPTTPARTPFRNSSSSQQFNTIQTPMSRRSSKRKKKRSVQASGLLGGRQQLVLEDIGGSHAADSEFTLDYHSPGTPWTKVILLEELGTASSWLVLLLPYISFLIALALDSTSILQDVTLDARGGAMPCSVTTHETEIFPLAPIPPSSCSYPYRIQEGAGLLSYVDARNEVVDRRYEFFMNSGEAVTSGPVKDVPTMSSFLYGDMTFAGLSSDAVSLVTKGYVLTSTAVFQRRFDDDDDASSEENTRQKANRNDEQWFPVSISEPKRLDMVCKYYSKEANWNCTSPQTVDVLFSLPATAVLTGGDIRVDTIFSYYPLRPYDSWNRRLSNKDGAESRTADEILSDADASDPRGILKELSRASALILRHQRPAYAETIVIVRLISLTISFCFLVYWIAKIGFTGFCCNRGNELFHDDQEDSDNESDCCVGSSCERLKRKGEDGLVAKKKKRGNLNWWESPWIVMPERRYLLIVLICLLMVQNPLLAVAFYKPKLFSSAQMHVAADCLVSSEV